MNVLKQLLALAALLLAAAPALAAGGHHAVDDAAILEPGSCELESWLTRVNDGTRLLHAGAGCRVGPVELGVAGEYARQSGASQTAWGLGVKWAQDLGGGLSIGASAGPVWQARARPRYQGATAALLATWMARDNLALHLNLGRDFVHRGADASRYGIAAEWSPAADWSLVAERYREADAHYLRAGARWAAGEQWSVDFSRAQRLSGPGASTWTLGLTRLLERP